MSNALRHVNAIGLADNWSPSLGLQGLGFQRLGLC